MEGQFVVLVRQDDKFKVYGGFAQIQAASDFLVSQMPDPMSSYMSGWVGWVAPLLDPESA